MAKSNKKKHIVKAWMALDRNGEIEDADYFNPSDCGCSGETYAAAVFLDKEKVKLAYIGNIHKVVPVTITYEL